MFLFFVILTKTLEFSTLKSAVFTLNVSPRIIRMYVLIIIIISEGEEVLIEVHRAPHTVTIYFGIHGI